MEHHPNVPSFDEEWFSHVLEESNFGKEADRLLKDLGINIKDIVGEGNGGGNEADYGTGESENDPDHQEEAIEGKDDLDGQPPATPDKTSTPAVDVMPAAIQEASIESPVKTEATDEEWLPENEESSQTGRRSSKRSVKKTLKRQSSPASEVSEGKRKKLYLQAKKSDPAAEKRRRDAINAKLNRDRKKAEQQEMLTKMENLSEDNERLTKENERLRALLVANGVVDAVAAGNIN